MFCNIIRSLRWPCSTIVSLNKTSTWRKLALQTSGLNCRHARKYSTPSDNNFDEVDVVNVVVIDKENKRHKLRGRIGENILELGRRYGLEIEGACEASISCSTCHVYIQEEHFDNLREPDRREEDMLDMAPFLTPTSRLGCQVILQRNMEGMEFQLPPATRNFYVDGHKPEPH